MWKYPTKTEQSELFHKTLQVEQSLHSSAETCKRKLVPKAGLEPARPLRRGILNPLRLPFRHLGTIRSL